MPGPADDGRYEIYVGGHTLMQDGKFISNIAPIAHYRDLKYKHVQGIWRVLSDPELMASGAPFILEVAKRLNRLGDAYGISQERMSKADFAEINKVAEAVKKGIST